MNDGMTLIYILIDRLIYWLADWYFDWL